MPTYQYTCTDCGEPVEAVQKFTDDPLMDELPVLPKDLKRMSGRSSHDGSLSDVVHSADEAPADAVGGRSTRPDRDHNRANFFKLTRNLAQPYSSVSGH